VISEYIHLLLGIDLEDPSAAGPSSKQGQFGEMLRGSSLTYINNRNVDIQSRPITDPNFEVDYWQCSAVSHLSTSLRWSNVECVVHVCQP